MVEGDYPPNVVKDAERFYAEHAACTSVKPGDDAGLVGDDMEINKGPEEPTLMDDVDGDLEEMEAIADAIEEREAAEKPA